MARFGNFVLLVILAVIPLSAIGRSTRHTLAMSTIGEANDDHFFFSIQSHYRPTGTDTCMDVMDGNIVMEKCEAGKVSQLWYAKDTVIVHYSGACMAVCDGPGCNQYMTPLDQVIASECSAEENQQFTTDGKTLVSTYNGHCLDVCKSVFCRPQYDVITYPCNGQDNQQWDLILGGYTGPASGSKQEISSS